MEPCTCKSLPDRVKFDDYYLGYASDFFTGFIVGPHRDELRAYVCPGCDTVWIHHEYDRIQMAIRVESVEELDSFDLEAHIREDLIAAAGGLSDKKCLFRGCDQQAIGKNAFCYDHIIHLGSVQPEAPS